jgi:hypothetical protein
VGGIERFSWVEQMTVSGEPDYRADFAGGLVDLPDALQSAPGLRSRAYRPFTIPPGPPDAQGDEGGQR